MRTLPPGRRGTTVALAALLLAGLSLTAPPATAGGSPPAARGATASLPSDSTPARRGTDEVVESDAVVPVRVGPDEERTVALDTRLYVPRSATARTPQPAVLMTHGFALSKTHPEVVSSARFLARHGYVVLTYTSSGFGASGGCITLQNKDFDVRGARQLLDRLVARDDVRKDARGPVVGMVGGSYGGGIQKNLAVVDRRVRAIVPGRTWDDLEYSLVPNNLVAPGDRTGFDHTRTDPGVVKLEWTSLLFASGNAQPVGGAPPSGGPKGGCPQEKLRSGEPSELAGLPCTGFPVAMCRAYANALGGRLSEQDRQLLAASSLAAGGRGLRVPTLLVQGQRDTLFNVNDALTTYTALRRAGTPVKMIWNYGGHGGYDSLPGECEVYGGGTGGPDAQVPGKGLDDCYLTLRTLAFLDQHLRGRPDPSPGFTWHRDWVTYRGSGAADEQYGAADAYPAMPSARLALRADGSLGAAPGPGGAVTLLRPPGGQPAAYSETSNFSGPQSPRRDPRQPYEVPGQHAAWTTPPVPRDVESVGVPRLRVRLAHQAPGDLVLFAKTYDVAPDGTATLVHRMVAPVRVPASSLEAPVDLQLVGFAHRFAKGHAARVVLTTTDEAYRNETAPDAVRVAVGGDSGSSLLLPGFPAGAPATGPAGPPGTAPAGPPAPAAAAPGSLPATGAAAPTALGLLALAGAGLLLRRSR